MAAFPEFIRNPINSVPGHQKSDGVEGYVFDGADGNQIILFQCSKSGISKEHVHEFDEYFVVIQGEYTLGLQGRTVKLTSGQEYYIPKGIPHDGAFIAGTRTINAFGGKRAERKNRRSISVNLGEIRQKIDSVDSDIIKLLSERAELVTAASKLKNDEKGVRDPRRVEQVIEKVKMKASAAGFDPAIAEEIYRTITSCFVRKEMTEFAERSKEIPAAADGCLIRNVVDQDCDGITAIFNHYVEHSYAAYPEQPLDRTFYEFMTLLSG